MTEKILTIEIQSKYQAGTTVLRTLSPEKPITSGPLTQLYVLPVNPGLDTPWGDGLETLRNLGLHDAYNLMAIAPSFSDWPWYADHPSDPHLQQERYFIDEIIPRVDALNPCMPKIRLLVGFSKSGFGAFSLILRYPELFQCAAAWDAPLMQTGPDEFEMGGIYGSTDNFSRYALPDLFARKANYFRTPKPRLGLFGYGNFREHMQAAHALLEQLHITHVYADGPYREHRWDSGWLAEAVAFLAGLDHSPLPGG